VAKIVAELGSYY